MITLAKLIKNIWTSKLTTAVLLTLAFAALLVSLVFNFGGPSPTKAMIRLLFVFVLAGHFASAYPRQLKNLLLGASDRISAAYREPRITKSFYLLSGLILGAGFFARFYRVTKFLTVDESKWLVYRIPTFFRELAAVNWHSLLISDKPGITVAWIVEAGLLFTDKEGTGVNLGDPQLLFASRLPLILANILLLFWLTLLVRRATKSNNIALLFLALTAINPNIMGMTSIVNPDSISWFFPLGAVLAFFLYLRDRRPWDLAAASFIFAAGVLNKFNFLIILPFLPIITVLYYLFVERIEKGFFRMAAITVTRLYLLSWFIAALFWPFLFLAPQQYIRQTLLRPVIKPLLIPIALSLIFFWLFSGPIERFLSRFRAPIKKVLLIGTPLASLGLIATTFLLTPGLPSVAKATKVIAPLGELTINNYYYHIYSQTTLTIILYILACLVLLIAGFRPSKTNTLLPLSVLSLLFIMFYLAGSAATGHITSPRYQIPVFPAVALLASVGLFEIIRFKTDRLAVTLVAAFAVINFALVLPFAPYYLFYHNHLLPEGKLVFDGWGLGGYEAAEYLNNKPNASELRVYASYGGFANFFDGHSIGRQESPFIQPVDYLVVFHQSANRLIIGDDLEKNNVWRQAKADWQMVINGVPVVKVIKFNR